MKEPVFDARSLRKSVVLPNQERLPILDGVDLTVRVGESVAIIGRSGSGKTTLLSVIGLLSRADEGSVTLAGVEVDSLSDRRRASLRNARIGFVFQSYSLVRHLSAAANVGLPLRYGAPVPARRRRAQALAALEMVGLAGRERSRPKHLSGGEQQRVAIARALVRNPDLILADEPTGALDVGTAASVLDVLISATTERGCALVVVTHDPAIAGRMSRVVELVDGKAVSTAVGA